MPSRFALITKVSIRLDFFSGLAFVASPAASSRIAAQMAAARGQVIGILFRMKDVGGVGHPEADVPPDVPGDETSLRLHPTFVVSPNGAFCLIVLRRFHPFSFAVASTETAEWLRDGTQNAGVGSSGDARHRRPITGSRMHPLRPGRILLTFAQESLFQYSLGSLGNTQSD